MSVLCPICFLNLFIDKKKTTDRSCNSSSRSFLSTDEPSPSTLQTKIASDEVTRIIERRAPQTKGEIILQPKTSSKDLPRLEKLCSTNFETQVCLCLSLSLSHFLSCLIAVRTLESEHQMRRNKIQSFISNLKQAKDPSKDTSSTTSIPSVSSFGPPSYCSAEIESPIPLPKQPLTRHPEISTSRLDSTAEGSHTIKKTASRDSTSSRRPHRDSVKPTERPPVASSARLRETRNEAKESFSPSSGDITRSKSAPRGGVIKNKQTRPSPQPSDVTPIVRKEKMRSIEEAAKLRVQLKKEQENEQKRFEDAD
jgi:hypothetical protein